MKRIFLVLSAACLLCTLGCETVRTTNAGAVGVERKQKMLTAVSSESIDQAAEEAYTQALTEAYRKHQLNTDQAVLARVSNIGMRLVAASSAFRADTAQWNWQFNVRTTNAINAWCMPGGRVMVYTGLIEKLDLNDAEIAVVLGHEIAHALREHVREEVARAYEQDAFFEGMALVKGGMDTTMGLAEYVGLFTFQLPFSREQESEADLIGLELAARAGYDPEAALSLWKKMEPALHFYNKPPEFLSTHPSIRNRVKGIEQNLPRVMPLYTASSQPPPATATH